MEEKENTEVKEILDSVKGDITATVKSELEAEIKAANDRSEALEAQIKDLEEASQKAVVTKEEEEKSFSFGDLAKAFHGAIQNNAAKLKTVMVEGTDSSGGYTLPKPLYSILIQKVEEYGTFKDLVTTVPMTSLTMDITEIVHALLDVYVTAEAAQKTETEATTARVNLTAKKLASVLPISDELIDDSAFDLVRVLVDLMAKKVARKIDSWIVSGNGTTEAEGILVNADVTTRSTALTGAVSYDAVVDTMLAVDSAYRQNGVFAVNTAELGALMKLKDTNGAPLWVQSTVEGQPSRLMGRPVVESEFVTAGVILFGDMKQYWLGERQSATIRVSTEARFEEDQHVIRTVARYAGKVVDANAFAKWTVA